MQSRKERRKELQVPRLHAKFIYTEKQDLPVRYEDKKDGRRTAYVTVEWYASTKVKDGSGDVINPQWIDLSRFEAWNAPLKCMHGRTVLSNVGVILSANADTMWLYIKAEARLDISKDNNGRPINQEDYTLYDRMMNRTINGFSIGFHNVVEWWNKELNANYIESMTAHEVSLVDVPDNPVTIVKMWEMYKHHNLSSDTDMKKTLSDFILKSLEAAGVKVGEMYRVKKEYGSGEWSWEYVANSELVKMSTTDDWASEENPMCYFLVYELKMEWYQPTTYVIKWLLNDIEVVDITPEQLKDLQDEETKDLETEEVEEDEEVETPEETLTIEKIEEKESEDKPQEEEVAWNGNGADQPENGEVKADEGEKVLKQLGEKDAELNETKQFLQESIEQSEKLVEENAKLLSIAEKWVERIKQLKEQIKTYKQLKVKHGLTVNKQQASKNPLENLVKDLRK